MVSDRANARLQYVELDGAHHATVDMGTSSPTGAAGHMPDNVDMMQGSAISSSSPTTTDAATRNLLVPSLDGTVAVLGPDAAVLSVLNMTELLGPTTCPHPHDAIFLENGDFVLCCWAPGHLSYWQRLPPADELAGVVAPKRSIDVA